PPHSTLFPYTPLFRSDPKSWAILVIAADGSDPTDGPGLAAKVVATGVVPDVERGPAWLPDSAGIVYVKDDRAEYNPLYLADLVRSEEHTSELQSLAYL